MPLGMELGLSAGDCVTWGPSPSPQKDGGAPKFSAHVYFGQTAGWIKMVLGMEVGLIPGDLVVLDGDPAPPQKGGRATSPIFGPFLLWRNGWMRHDATWYGARPQPGDFVLDGDPAPSTKRWRSPQIFGPCLLWSNGWMDQDGI